MNHNKMTRLVLTVLLSGVCGLAARAESSTYSANVGARYVDLDTKHSRNMVQEYDGKLYYIGHGDASVSGQGSQGLFDLGVNDIGSTEENAALRLDTAGGLRVTGLYNTISHRQAYLYNLNQVNGLIVANNLAADITIKTPAYSQQLFRRHEAAASVGYVSPTNSARFIKLDAWMVDKKGDQAWIYNKIEDTDNVDNTKVDLTLSGGVNLGENGALALDLIRSEFRDNALVVTRTNLKPALPQQQLTATELKWRFDPSKNLALTGAVTARQRENRFSATKQNVGVLAGNAAYKASEKLSLTGRLYVRQVQIDENNSFRSALVDSTGAPLQGQGNELDKLAARGELDASYRPIEKLLVKASYKVEMNHRRDAPTQFFGAATYQDGSAYGADEQSNVVATEDTKHTFGLAVKAELPLGIGAEASYKHLKANRAGFESLPTWKDAAEAGFDVPLPGHTDFWARYSYAKERNSKTQLMAYTNLSQVYSAGVDMEMSEKVALGLDASYDSQRYSQTAYFGQDNIITGSGSTAGIITDATGRMMRLPLANRQNSSTAGGHTRIVLPAGFVALLNGSYTVMKGMSSVDLNPITYNGAGSIGKTPAGTGVGDLTPLSIRVAHGTAALEFTPSKYKNLTARASYSVDDWVDKFDTTNSGRASVAQLGASMKF